MSRLFLRLAISDDLVAINDIYNHYVASSTCTYQEEPERIESRRAWFDRHGEKHPIVVAIMDDKIVGWGSLSPYHVRSAYRFTVENSIYVRHDLHRRGIGAALLQDLLHRAAALQHHSVMALIDADQAGSIALHQRFGFAEIGRLNQVGFKFDRWLDVVYMQKML